MTEVPSQCVAHGFKPTGIRQYRVRLIDFDTLASLASATVGEASERLNMEPRLGGFRGLVTLALRPHQSVNPPPANCVRQLVDKEPMSKDGKAPNRPGVLIERPEGRIQGTP